MSRAKCGAKKRNGGKCANAPCEGSTRCRMHGGSPNAKPTTLVHGRYALRFKRLSQPAQDAIDSALVDPDLLDARRPVAVHQAVLESSSLVPTDEEVEAYARHISKWRPNFDADPPQTWDDRPAITAPELEVARMLWAEAAGRLTQSYGVTLSAASRAVKLGDVLAKEMVPLFSDLGLRMRKLGDRFVVAERRQDFEDAFRIEVRSAVAQILQISEDAK